MNEMVERVAWAIAGQQGGELDDRWRRKARAGIEAMREPTPAMVTAARIKCHIRGIATARCWHEMIDEALKPVPEA